MRYGVRSIDVGRFEEPGPAVFWQQRFEDWISLALQLILIQGGGRTVITPIFLTNRYAEIWNRRPAQHFDRTATQVVDRTAAFAGWGPYEGFARTYDVDAFCRRVIAELPNDVTASIHLVTLDDQPVPDPRTNRHIPVLNRDMKALVLQRR